MAMTPTATTWMRTTEDAENAENIWHGLMIDPLELGITGCAIEYVTIQRLSVRHVVPKYNMSSIISDTRAI